MATHSSPENFSLPVAIVIGSVIIGGSIIFASTRTSSQPSVAAFQPIQQAPSQPAQLAPAIKADIKTVKAAGAKIVGNRSAPITVAYWYDYNCGFCKGSEDQIISPLMNEYVKTGKIRIIFKDLQFLKSDSTKLGIAGRAVWEVAPAKFYDWHKLMFDNQNQLSLENNDKLLALTTQVLGKANADKVISLMASKEAAYKQLIEADKSEGSAFNIRSTPSFIVGDQIIVGLKSYSEVKNAVDAYLKK